MASAILNVRSAVAPRSVSRTCAIDKSTRDFLRLFAFDCRRADRQRLVCRWHQDSNGRLICIWEPDHPRPEDGPSIRRVLSSLTLCTPTDSMTAVVPSRDQKGMRCMRFGAQLRSRARNCERRAYDRERHWEPRLLGRWSKARTRKPGDLPLTAVTRERMGRGVLM